MGKIIFYSRLVLLMWLLFSCGQSNFSKRKFTKGIYLEKRTHVKSRKAKIETEKYSVRSNKTKKKEESILSHHTDKKTISDQNLSQKKIKEIDPSSVVKVTDDNITDSDFGGDNKVSEYTIPATQDNKNEGQDKVQEKGKTKNGNGMLWTGIALLIIGVIACGVAILFWLLAWIPFLIGFLALIAGVVLIIKGVQKKKGKNKKLKNQGNGKHKKKAVAAVTTASIGFFFLPLGYLMGWLTVGRIALFSFWGAALALGITAIILAILTLRKKDEISQKEKSMAIAGLVLGIIAIIAALALLISFFA